MKRSRFATIAVLAMTLLTAAGCANTIKGMGQDTANAVNATEQAGNKVAKAAN